MTFLQFAFVIPGTVLHDFKVSKNQIVDMAASETCLISSLNKSSKMTCIGSCYSNVECLTVVYDQSKGMTKNCFIYNRYFKPNELKPSSTSTAYEKKLGST
jgi:putative IMPACT (imprinted ancient) family translation regulator